MNFLNPDSVWAESEMLVAFAVQMKKSSDSKAVLDHFDKIICKLDKKLLRKCRAMRKSLNRHRASVIKAQKGILLSNGFFVNMVNILEKAKGAITALDSVETTIRNDIEYHTNNLKNRKEVSK